MNQEFNWPTRQKEIQSTSTMISSPSSSPSSPTAIQKVKMSGGSGRGGNGGGGSETQFPGKLHNLMEYAIDHGKEDVISWVNDGRAILIHNPKRLIAEILPYYFSHTKIRSLERQFNMWHFERITYGPYKGAWMHPYFQRDNRSLCSKMSRNLADNPWKLRLQHQRAVTLPTILQDDDGATSRLLPPRSLSYGDVSRGSLLKSPRTSSSSLDANFMTQLPQQLLQLPPKALSDTELDVSKASLSIKQQQLNQEQFNSLSEDGDQVTFAGRKFHFLDGVVDNGNISNSTTNSNNNTTNPMFSSLLELWGQSPMQSTATLTPLPIQHRQQEQQQLPLWSAFSASQQQQQLPSVVGSSTANLPMERIGTTSNAMDLNFMDTVADSMNLLQANTVNTSTFINDATTSNESRMETLRSLFSSESTEVSRAEVGGAVNDTTKRANINIDNFTSGREDEESEADRLYRLSLRSLFLSVAAEAAAEATATNNDTNIEDM